MELNPDAHKETIVKKLIAIIGVLAIVAVLVWHFTCSGAQKQSYRLVTVERGNLEETVASTGRARS